MIDTFADRCFVYNCTNHSIAHPMPRVRVDPVPPFPCPVPGLDLPTDSIRRSRASAVVRSSSNGSMAADSGESTATNRVEEGTG